MIAEHPVLAVFLMASITALATGLGAVPFAFMRTVSSRAVSYSNALAAGLMLGATFGLTVEGSAYGVWQTLVGANLGVVFVLLAARFLERPDEARPNAVLGLGARRTLLIVLVMTVHSFSEGVAVGAAFAGSAALGAFITVAIAVHNIPEGLAISAVMRPRGASIAACAGWSVFSSLPQPLMAVPAYLLVDTVRPALPYTMGFAAGAMILMVLQELLPEAYEEGRRSVVGMVVALSLFAMVFFQRFL